MRTMIRLITWTAIVVAYIGIAHPCLAAHVSKIEAVKDKKYRLSRDHGPWMIMVASFKEPPREFRSKDGLTPEAAADQLVYELRRKGIPAYVVHQEEVQTRIGTLDRTGRKTEGLVTAQQGMVSVLAGNYGSIDAENSRDGKVAQQTLAYVKKFSPKFLRDKSSGARVRFTPGQKGPLAGAFLTINPLLSPEEARQRKHDPLVLKLNHGMDFSLLDNEGRYTLVVASFYGKSITSVSDSKFQDLSERFEIGGTLDQAMLSAWELAHALRNARAHGYDQDFEAYVFHDRYRSIVTIGAFDTPNDPLIPKLQQLFQAKMKTLRETGGRDVLLAEAFTIPRNAEPHTAEKSWIFDPNPQLVPVPKFK